MNQDTIKQQLITLIQKTFHLSESEQLEAAGMGVTQGWGSLQHIKLILNIENQFSIKIPSNQIQETANFQSLLQLLTRILI